MMRDIMTAIWIVACLTFALSACVITGSTPPPDADPGHDSPASDHMTD